MLRLRTHVRTEENFGSLSRGYVDQHAGIKGEALGAVNWSYRGITGGDLEGDS